MNDPKLGQLLTGGEERDAIHIAIAPAVAGENMSPGDDVFLRDGKAHTTFETSEAYSYVGIVDPFLDKRVAEGQRFWLFLYPRTVTSLRHHWTHPAFDGQQEGAVPAQGEVLEIATDKATATFWLQDFAHKIGLDYDFILAAAKAWVGGTNLAVDLPFGKIEIADDLTEEFWENYRTLTGTGPEATTQSFFTCCV